MDGENRKNKPAFIWDLDGTLLDSYAVIVPNLRKAYEEFGLTLEPDDIYREIILRSVSDFMKQTEREHGIPFDALSKRVREINYSRLLAIGPTKNAAEILRYLRERGIPNLLFTHRGASTATVLQNTGLSGFFEDAVTGTDGFARKPDPSALLYLLKKHRLDPDSTYYVGDRPLDIACAERAGILSVLFLPAHSPAKVTGKETRVVRDLMEIAALVP